MMNVEDEVRDVVRDTPGPDVIPAWDTVTTRGRRIRGRRRIGRATLALGVVGAIGLGIVYVTRSSDGSSRSIVANPAPGDPPVTTSADGSSDTDPSVIPPGQYRYVRVTGHTTATAYTPNNETYTVLVPTTYEFWIGADDSGRIRINDGDPTFLTPENEQIFNDAGLTNLPTLAAHSDRAEGPGDMHSLDLSTLPIEPTALRDALSNLTHTGPSDNAERLLEGLSDNLWMTYGPTRNARALVSALSSTPGMEVRTSDGMTIVSADEKTNGVRKELWFDSATGEIRRTRRVIVDATIPYKLHAPNGTVLEDAALEEARLVPSTDATP